MAVRAEGEVEQFQAGDGLKARRCVERERRYVVGLGLYRYAMDAGGTGVVDDMFEQGQRDAGTAVSWGDVEVADRPGGGEHQRSRHKCGGDEAAGVVGVDGRNRSHALLCELVVKPATGDLAGGSLAVVRPVFVEQGGYLVERRVERRYRRDCHGHNVQSRRRSSAERPWVRSRSQIFIVAMSTLAWYMYRRLSYRVATARNC